MRKIFLALCSVYAAGLVAAHIMEFGCYAGPSTPNPSDAAMCEAAMWYHVPLVVALLAGLAWFIYKELSARELEKT